MRLDGLRFEGSASYVTTDDLNVAVNAAMTLARAEGLDAHRRSIEVRLRPAAKA